MDYAALKTELQKPAYTGLSDAAAAAAVNAATVQTTRTVISAYEVINAMVATEWAALTAQEKQRFDTITGAGQVDASNTNVRAAFAAMFANGTQTRTNLLALQNGPVVSLAVSSFGRLLDFADVAEARKA